MRATGPPKGNYTRWGITDGFRLARTVGEFLGDRVSYSNEDFIEAAEKAAKLHPIEWVVFYSLADKLMAVGQYGRALQAAKRAQQIRPNDIRSAYMLATAYNMLTRAEWTVISEQLKALAADMYLDPKADKFDPERSKGELEELGMTLDTAAAQAIRWFERSLQLRPDAGSLAEIRWDLATLYKRFPHLRE